MTRAFLSVLRRDLLLAFRHRQDLLNPLLFFIITCSLFPLGVSPEQAFLGQSAAGILWVAALLATLLSLDMLFRADFEDGALEQLLLAPQPLFLLVLAKIIAHWLVTGLPLVLLSPLLALMLFLPSEQIPLLMLSLLLGTPALSLVGAVGAALIVGLRGGGVLLSLLILPLYVPILIFATGVLQAAAAGLPYTGQLAMLAAFLALALALAPLAVAAALRISVSG